MTTELEQKRQKARKYADVAIELVKEGLFLEEFVTDKRASVRATIVEHHPQLRHILLTLQASSANFAHVVIVSMKPLIWHNHKVSIISPLFESI